MLLYIHIPFCDSKCHYCAFNSYTSLHSLRDSYIQALCKQLEFELKTIDKKALKTIFIGGGTPSTIDVKSYETIFKVLKNHIDNVVEITIEANPNSASFEWLNGIKQIGINRISFGVQSFDDDKLKFLGRNHNSKMAIQAIQNAKSIGFEHINCDIIYDTQLDTKSLIEHDLLLIQTLPIDHISAYSLTLEEGTKFYNKSNVKVEDEQIAKYIFKRLDKLGFNQYEISNFALNDKAKSKHNLGYWQYEQYLGIGAGAVGCIDNQRYYNKKDVMSYISNPLEFEEIEELSDEDIKTEKVLLGLRSEVGIEQTILKPSEMAKANELKHLDKIFVLNNRLYAKNFLLADELSLYILE